MTRYYLSSAAFHLLLAVVILLSPFFRRPSGPGLMVEGFDYLGGGGAAGPSGPRKEAMGQVVPKPVDVPVPKQAGPEQKATKSEDAWKVEKAPPKPEAPTRPAPPPVERGEKTQKETTNIIRRGVSPKTTAGEGGFEFGEKGTDGKDVGVGVGPGEGFGGFGSYLKLVRQRIWAEWSQSAVYGSKQMCIIGITIRRDGSVTNLTIEKGSGDGFYDSVALRAVRNASPMPPLPAAFPRSEQRIRIQFRLED